jgi:YihY family inner membrane protein
VSTATRVPETWQLTGDDARQALAATGRLRLLRDAFVRFRAADGFSHARSLAFVTSLVLVQSLIVVVGLVAAFGGHGFSQVVVDTVRSAAPGPAGQVLTDAVQQANRVANHHRFLPLVVGLLGTLVTATTAMGQLERGFNRLYGVERDRPSLQKYGRALLLAVSIGVALALAFVLLALGRDLQGGHSTLRALWLVVRWPLGLVVAALALAALLRFAPRRRQPGRAWLGFAAGVCVMGWTLVTLMLGLAFHVSSSFGQVYGPLAGVVALQLWALLSAIAVFFGAAVAAQLEAVRAGRRAPSEAEASASARDGDAALARAV